MKKLVVYIFGLFLLALGVSFSSKSNLGLSAVSALPYALGNVWGISFGNATILTHLVYVGSQVFILRKQFKKRYLLQIPFGILFGVFIDLTGMLLIFSTPDVYLFRVILQLASIMFISFGLLFIIVPHIVDSTAEGFIRAITIRYNKDFGRVKLIHDIITSTSALLIGLVFLNDIVIIREGTIISALLVGPIIGVLIKTYKESINRFFV
ncbi:hypothetical protein KHQ82_01655 [Mycoplasmatota bacterium]|nr:hypothetical protein KHQ82_01655 [Mycoplasmatota bacterium]